MSKRRRVLITVFARAAWGGLHENVLAEVRALVAVGTAVSVACAESRLANRLRLSGAHVIPVDWANMQASIDKVIAHGAFDIVHAHPFLARELAFEVLRVHGGKCVITMHGNYLDYMNSWATKADHIICVSTALRDKYIREVSSAHADKFSVIANGVEDNLFSFNFIPLDRKIKNDSIEIVVASRLDTDKAPLVDATLMTVRAVRAEFPAHKIHVRALGEGNVSASIQETFEAEGVKTSFDGWAMSERVPEILSQAAIAVCPGRSAAQSIAVGTVTVAAGSQGIVGLQSGEGLIRGHWSNFGGYPVDAIDVKLFDRGVKLALSESLAYSREQILGREYIKPRLSQSVIDAQMISLFESLHHSL